MTDPITRLREILDKVEHEEEYFGEREFALTLARVLREVLEHIKYLRIVYDTDAELRISNHLEEAIARGLREEK